MAAGEIYSLSEPNLFPPGLTFSKMLKHLTRLTNKLQGKSFRKGVDYDPYDGAVRAHLADHLFHQHLNDEPLGSVGRGRMLLDLIETSFPSDALTAAYFENLELLMKSRRPRQSDGQIVLGLGTGRSGSTSLVEILTTVQDSCCTHENPPLVSWTPQKIELDFQIRRFERLSRYYSLIADVSHWWINVLDEVLNHFPNAKAIGLFRDAESCVKSFMQIKGFGRGSYNHWVPHGNGIWAAARWDPTYPTYPVPNGAEYSPDRAKSELIAQYVRDYNRKLHLIASRAPERILLVETEKLGLPETQTAILDFVGLSGKTADGRRNVGTTIDGRHPELKF